MGWTSTDRRGMPVKEFISQKVLRWSPGCGFRSKVLDSAIVGMTTYYAAVERVDDATGERTVWAAVILLQYGPRRSDPYDFAYKAMDESQCPNEAKCPARILHLLTATDDEGALAWRAACRAAIALRASIGPGCSLTLYGTRYRVTEALGRAGWKATGPDGRAVRIKRIQAAECIDLVLDAAPAAEAVPVQAHVQAPQMAQAELF